MRWTLVRALCAAACAPVPETFVRTRGAAPAFADVSRSRPLDDQHPPRFSLRRAALTLSRARSMGRWCGARCSSRHRVASQTVACRLRFFFARSPAARDERDPELRGQLVDLRHGDARAARLQPHRAPSSPSARATAWSLCRSRTVRRSSCRVPRASGSVVRRADPARHRRERRAEGRPSPPWGVSPTASVSLPSGPRRGRPRGGRRLRVRVPLRCWTRSTAWCSTCLGHAGDAARQTCRPARSTVSARRSPSSRAMGRTPSMAVHRRPRQRPGLGIPSVTRGSRAGW